MKSDSAVGQKWSRVSGSEIWNGEIIDFHFWESDQSSLSENVMFKQRLKSSKLHGQKLLNPKEQ